MKTNAKNNWQLLTCMAGCCASSFSPLSPAVRSPCTACPTRRCRGNGGRPGTLAGTQTCCGWSRRLLVPSSRSWWKQFRVTTTVTTLNVVALIKLSSITFLLYSQTHILSSQKYGKRCLSYVIPDLFNKLPDSLKSYSIVLIK